jgi:trans-2-enoyl-CoA reductase
MTKLTEALDKVKESITLHEQAGIELHRLFKAIIVKEARVATDTIDFTPKMYRELHARYQQALAADEEEFDFEGHRLLTEYAKYLLEYLHDRLLSTGHNYPLGPKS